MEWDLGNTSPQGDQQRQKPGVERRMRLAAHVDVAAHEYIQGVHGMQRFNLRMGGLSEIQDVVALHGLVEKGQAQSQDSQRDEYDLAAQVSCRF